MHASQRSAEETLIYPGEVVNSLRDTILQLVLNGRCSKQYKVLLNFFVNLHKG